MNTHKIIQRTEDYYIHQSQGILEYDPLQGTKHFQPWWLLLKCDPAIIEYYCWLMLKFGKPVQPNKLWGSHISVIKGETPPKNWGLKHGDSITFYYAHRIRWDNGRHAWLDCWSSELDALRKQLGIQQTKMSYHLTLGRIR